MRAVVQRVAASRVEIGGETVGEIGQGLMILLGVCLLYTSDAADEL